MDRGRGDDRYPVVAGWFWRACCWATYPAGNVLWQAFAGGDLDRRVRGDAARTELGSVARAINAMLAQIQSAFFARDTTEAELRASEGR